MELFAQLSHRIWSDNDKVWSETSKSSFVCSPDIDTTAPRTNDSFNHKSSLRSWVALPPSTQLLVRQGKLCFVCNPLCGSLNRPMPYNNYYWSHSRKEEQWHIKSLKAIHPLLRATEPRYDYILSLSDTHTEVFLPRHTHLLNLIVLPTHLQFLCQKHRRNPKKFSVGVLLYLAHRWHRPCLLWSFYPFIL